jgi:hypothetical protein
MLLRENFVRVKVLGKRTPEIGEWVTANSRKPSSGTLSSKALVRTDVSGATY